MSAKHKRILGAIDWSNLLTEATSHTCGIDTFREQSWGL